MSLAEEYWNIAREYIFSNEVEDNIRSGLHSRHYTSSSEFLDKLGGDRIGKKTYLETEALQYIRENIDLYDYHYGLLSKKNNSHIDIFTLYLYIASIASLRSYVPISLDEASTLRELRMKNMESLVLLTNHTGYFESCQFIEAYLEGKYIIGIPSKVSIADGVSLCPLNFIIHDINHNIDVPILTESSRNICQRIYDSLRNNELLVHALCHVIHEDYSVYFTMSRERKDLNLYSDYDRELLYSLSISRLDKGIIDLSKYRDILEANKDLLDKYYKKYNILAMPINNIRSKDMATAIAMLDDHISKL